jgi:hypothetical protein
MCVLPASLRALPHSASTAFLLVSREDMENLAGYQEGGTIHEDKEDSGERQVASASVCVCVVGRPAKHFSNAAFYTE